jgi:hypothetical protein
MGALLGALFVVGIGALVLGGKKSDKGPKPTEMIGTPIMRITSGVHVLTITRHAQGYAWYVSRGSLVNASSNESSKEGAVEVGLESFQGNILPTASLKIANLEPPEQVGTVEPVGAADGPWVWRFGPLNRQEPTRPEAVMELLDAMQVPLEGEPEGGIIGEPAKFQHGIAIVGEDFEVQDIDAWIEAASPVVVDAIDAGDTTPQELADAVFGFLLGYDTDGLMVDGRPWDPGATAKVLSEVLADEYLDVAPPDHKLAAALVMKNHTMVGQAGVENGHAWVARPVGQLWEWLLFEGGRGLDSDAVDSGPANDLIDARQQAKDAAHLL